jgi:hypothetical protein
VCPEEESKIAVQEVSPPPPNHRPVYFHRVLRYGAPSRSSRNSIVTVHAKHIAAEYLLGRKTSVQLTDVLLTQGYIDAKYRDRTSN